LGWWQYNIDDDHDDGCDDDRANDDKNDDENDDENDDDDDEENDNDDGEEPFPNDAKVMSDPESAEEHSDVVEPDEEPDFEFFRALDRYRLEQMPLEYPVQPGFQGYPGWQISSGSFPQYVASGWNGWEEAW